MKNSDKIRAQFEERYPVPSGMRWEPAVGQAGDYILSCVACCSGDRAARYIARWEAWQASREAVMVELPPRKSIDHYCYDQGANCKAEGHNQCRSQVASAIEAHGLKVV